MRSALHSCDRVGTETDENRGDVVILMTLLHVVGVVARRGCHGAEIGLDAGFSLIGGTLARPFNTASECVSPCHQLRVSKTHHLGLVLTSFILSLPLIAMFYQVGEGNAPVRLEARSGRRGELVALFGICATRRACEAPFRRLTHPRHQLGCTAATVAGKEGGRLREEMLNVRSNFPSRLGRCRRAGRCWQRRKVCAQTSRVVFVPQHIPSR